MGAAEVGGVAREVVRRVTTVDWKEGSLVVNWEAAASEMVEVYRGVSWEVAVGVKKEVAAT